MNRSGFSTAVLPAGLVLAGALVCVWGVPVPGAPFLLEHMPRGCNPGQTYCTHRSTYPQSHIDSLLKQYHISVSSNSSKPTGDRILDGSTSICHQTALQDYSPIHYIHVGSHVRVVVQSEQFLEQTVRLERCLNNTKVDNPSIPKFSSTCVQRTLNYTFVVLSGDGTALEAAAVELPVYCALRLVPRGQ